MKTNKIRKISRKIRLGTEYTHTHTIKSKFSFPFKRYIYILCISSKFFLLRLKNKSHFELYKMFMDILQCYFPIYKFWSTFWPSDFISNRRAIDIMDKYIKNFYFLFYFSDIWTGSEIIKSTKFLQWIWKYSI